MAGCPMLWERIASATEMVGRIRGIRGCKPLARWRVSTILVFTMPTDLKPTPHSRDLRKGRVSLRGQIYHVRSSTAGRKPVFKDFALGREVVKGMRFLHERGDVESLAFVVMPDHFHWLFNLAGSRSLDAVVQSLKRHTARVVNQRLGCIGSVLWQPGFYDRAVRKEEDLDTLARYIVANPARAGLCSSIWNYSLWDAVWL